MWSDEAAGGLKIFLKKRHFFFLILEKPRGRLCFLYTHFHHRNLAAAASRGSRYRPGCCLNWRYGQRRAAAAATPGGPLCFSYTALQQSYTRNTLIINASYFNVKMAFFGL